MWERFFLWINYTGPAQLTNRKNTRCDVIAKAENSLDGVDDDSDAVAAAKTAVSSDAVQIFPIWTQPPFIVIAVVVGGGVVVARL